MPCRGGKPTVRNTWLQACVSSPCGCPHAGARRKEGPAAPLGETKTKIRSDPKRRCNSSSLRSLQTRAAEDLEGKDSASGRSQTSFFRRRSLEPSKPGQSPNLATEGIEEDSPSYNTPGPSNNTTTRTVTSASPQPPSLPSPACLLLRRLRPLRPPSYALRTGRVEEGAPHGQGLELGGICGHGRAPAGGNEAKLTEFRVLQKRLAAAERRENFAVARGGLGSPQTPSKH